MIERKCVSSRAVETFPGVGRQKHLKENIAELFNVELVGAM